MRTVHKIVVQHRSASPSEAWESITGYPKAIRIGPWVAVTATTAATADGGAVGGDDIGLQTREVLHRIRSVLLDQGMDIPDIVRIRIYVTDINRWKEVGRAYREFFGETSPATAIVEVSRLIEPALLVQIEVDAIIS